MVYIIVIPILPDKISEFFNNRVKFFHILITLQYHIIDNIIWKKNTRHKCLSLEFLMHVILFYGSELHDSFLSVTLVQKR